MDTDEISVNRNARVEGVQGANAARSGCAANKLLDARSWTPVVKERWWGFTLTKAVAQFQQEKLSAFSFQLSAIERLTAES
jgi:hypothetical protein